jgi:CheY-like chemotaxis protein
MASVTSLEATADPVETEARFRVLVESVKDYAIFILDPAGHVRMPGMNGWDFYEQLRLRPHLAAVPVIVHSSAPSGAPSGVTRVLRKPLVLDRLLAVVREFCG